ncbi:MAG: Mpo1-like protein [Steroidobacteraceae bacterium]
MRTATEWLNEYAASHRNPVNKRLHWLCVPAIVLAVLAMLSELPVPPPLAALSPWFNFATLAVLGAFVYYLRLAPGLAVVALLPLVAMLVGIASASARGLPVLPVALVVFVVAWIGQFIGHHVEGARPSFFKDLQFLLIGPLWLVATALGYQQRRSI